MKRLVLMIIPALISVMRKNFLGYAKCIAILLIVAGFSSCDRQSSFAEPEEVVEDPPAGDNPSYEDDDDPPIFDTFEPKNVRLAKIVKYSNSTASKLTGEVIYTYDEAGNLHRVSYFDEWNNTMICLYFIEYEYYENKKVKESYFNCNANSHEEGPVMYSYIEYFYQGALLVREERDGGWAKYEYDEKGNLVEKNTYNDIHQIVNVWKYTYDDQDRLILEETPEIDASDYYHKYLKYIYDDHGREKKLEYYNVDNVLIRYTEKFYKETSTIEFRYDKNGNQTAKYQHFFDKWGNLTETVINDECSMFKRKYDGGLLMEEIHYWAHEYGYHYWGQVPESGMSMYEYEEI